ncbi:alpha-D-ribose 1-methylphosphonate 5-phosphate C-P lyase [Caldanaerovirga acetigignens]|uniref:Alpha-D-ribose 1-methylphosphonate 5-phosphate C-P lyase n=1 Tax=Caldanaerovirga acetigignens TaxID=447595 RepID=A0A1M7LNE6_9FIRM|nr:alpha-D-ribose 1-methylphosphonate 5-phosphate C-P-lyase PhnJ [Caldanaerovirga acetigignens]SHM79774.1 alpha-D-ribose 1-methylphosphonate 5-phosphate C-P lyase [Caldanaerovirga acetigignens]
MLDEYRRQRGVQRYNFAFLNEQAKREIRRKILKAVAIPGYQVPFGSQELPIARGWGTGGLQITLSLLGPDDVVKVIDQGCDGSVNAVNLRKLIVRTTGIKTTFNTREATIIQTRHRIPEVELTEEQILVFQVPIPEALRTIEASEASTRRMHAEMDYGRMWVYLYEDIVRWGDVTIGARYPVMVNDRYIMDPSPIPRWDVPKLNMAKTLFLFGAGREKRIYAVPPHTKVLPLEFEDYKFHVEDFSGKKCSRCGSTESFLIEVFDDVTRQKVYMCSDTNYCDLRVAGQKSEGIRRYSP